MYDEKEIEETKRIHDQLSAAEVPGFAARTVIDDTIQKLWIVRQQLKIDVLDEIAGLLDDLEKTSEALINVALDESAPEIDDGEAFPVPDDYVLNRHICWSRTYAVSGASPGWCSCGNPCL